MKKQEKFPTIRVRQNANQHVSAVVKALKAKGVVVSKTSLVSDLMLSIPMPEETPAPTKRRTRKAVTASQVTAMPAA